MRNVVGNPVSGDDFYGRDIELASLIRLICNGNHTLIKSPRRVGKSSIVAEASRQLKSQRWVIVEIDVQHCTDESNFLRAISESIEESGVEIPLGAYEKISVKLTEMRRILAGFKGGAGGVSLEVPEFSETWEYASGQLRSHLKRLAKTGCKILVTMDELPIFLSELAGRPDGEQRIKNILNWLRGVRTACGSNLSWVMCGSIGLNNFVKERDLDGTINDFADLHVGVISKEEAIGLLNELVGSSPDMSALPTPVIEEIISKVGWLLPYYLQLMFHSLLSVSPRSEEFPDQSDVDAAYKIAIRADSLRHWSSRLTQLLTPDKKRRAKLILDCVSTHPAGVTRDELLNVLLRSSPGVDSDEMSIRLRDILKLLEDDGYLHLANDKVAFRSFLLRDHWKREYFV